MSALALLLAALGTALVFFALVPGAGAFAVRWQWRLFRRRMREASLAPFLRYSDLGGSRGLRGDFRVFGELEAIQGRDRIWINTGEFTVEADVSGAQLYLLPSLSGSGSEPLPDEEPAVAPWNRVFSLPSGLSLFVGGSLYLEEGRGVFRSSSGSPLLVVFYDGERESILKRAIWGGRKRNEYWNPFTLPSLLAGFLCLALLAYLSLRSAQAGWPGLAVLALAAAPAAPFLPPGVVLYYLYRYFWKLARRLRAERDLLRLPLRYFPEGSPAGERAALLPSGERYLMCREGSVAVEGQPETRTCAGHQETGEAWLFGAVEERDSRRMLRRPADPMAELLRVPGDAAALSARCERSARGYELAAAACFCTGLGINLFGVLLLLARLLA
jgi:hypothetical protein